MKLLDSYLKQIEKELKKPSKVEKSKEIGIVSEVKDGVVILSGLDNVSFGELIQFSNNVVGYIIDMIEDQVGSIVLGDYIGIKAGDTAKAMGITLSVPVCDSIIGRVIDPLGVPLDGFSKLKTDKYYPLEKIAPGVVERQSVNVPIQTGIKVIDALIPIGRGQRELIIGDRTTGKTTLAIDTILNQKNKQVICIYCAIGQRNAKIASTLELLKKHKALDYTIIVSASSSESVALQYLAPYSASAIGEYFMDKGKDVLIVYDDLTKHSWAYREISLILRRPSGREAYPGDVFYLHSRLLERACKLNIANGGGSITALPIIETLDGDVSSYIPTNVISITDGQIFLEADLFNAGIRPALNVGLSVSRVGGDAQTKAIKQVAGRLKLDLTQYRELAAFSQFQSDLDENTKKILNRGAKITQILKQNKNELFTLAEEVVILWAASNGYLDDIATGDVETFERRLLDQFRTKGKKILDEINVKKALDKKLEEQIKKFVEDNK